MTYIRSFLRGGKKWIFSFVHESRPEFEKMENGGSLNTKGADIETPSISEKGAKRARE